MTLCDHAFHFGKNGKKINVDAVKKLTGQDKITLSPVFLCENFFNKNHTVILHTGRIPTGVAQTGKPRFYSVRMLAINWLIPLAISSVLLFSVASVTVIKLAEVAESVPAIMVADADNQLVTP